MSSISMRVLELLDKNLVSFEEAEKLLQALAINLPSTHQTLKMRITDTPNQIHIPPHFSSYMNALTLDKQI